MDGEDLDCYSDARVASRGDPMIIAEIDKRLNAIYAAHDALRRAEVEEDKKTAEEKLSEGLSLSCLFLTDLRGDSNLTSLKGDNKAVLVLRRMAKENRLETFLNVERTLLGQTKLEPAAIDELMRALGRAAEKAEVDDHWQGNLERFTSLVCSSARGVSASMRRRPLLRRAFVAGGGGIIALANAVPPVSFPLPAPFVSFSITAGLFLMHKAFESEIDELLDD